MRNVTHGVRRALCAAALAAALGACSDFINNVPGNENVVQNAKAIAKVTMGAMIGIFESVSVSRDQVRMAVGTTIADISVVKSNTVMM